MTTQASNERSGSAPDAETSATEETVAAHAKRAVRARILARITAMLDRWIASLQKLRAKTGGAPAAEKGDDRSGHERPRERRDEPAAAPVPEAPKPKRRLLALLIYLAVLLIGGIGGGALAYIQFQKQLGVQLQDKQRLKAELAKKIRPTGELAKAFEQEQARRAQAEKTLAASLATYAESTGHSYAVLERLLGEQLAERQRMAAALAETTRASTDARKALAEEQTKRTQLETKLASALADHEQYSKEQDRLLASTEKQLIKAERQLDRLLGDDYVPSTPRRETTSRRSSARSERPASTGSCTMEPGSASGLKGCIEEFNR